MIAYVRALCACVAFTFLGLIASGAQAQQAGVFVSATGSDTADCSAATPCATLNLALARTADGGTIYIQGPFVSSVIDYLRPVSIVASGNVIFNQFLVSRGSPNLLFSGIQFKPSTATGGAPSSGFTLNTSAKVTLKDCVFDGYTGPAVKVLGAAGASGRVTLENVVIKGSQYGVQVQSRGGGANSAFIRNSFIDTSVISAVQVDGAANNAVIIGSTLSGSGQVDLSLVNGGRATSYGDNVIRSGAPTQTLPTN